MIIKDTNKVTIFNPIKENSLSINSCLSAKKIRKNIKSLDKAKEERKKQLQKARILKKRVKISSLKSQPINDEQLEKLLDFLKEQHLTINDIYAFSWQNLKSELFDEKPYQIKIKGSLPTGDIAVLNAFLDQFNTVFPYNLTRQFNACKFAEFYFKYNYDFSHFDELDSKVDKSHSGESTDVK